MPDESKPDDGWTWSWEQHEMDELRRGARQPLAAKVAWLEEAHRVVLSLERSGSSRRGLPGGA